MQWTKQCEKMWKRIGVARGLREGLASRVLFCNQRCITVFSHIMQLAWRTGKTASEFKKGLNRLTYAPGGTYTADTLCELKDFGATFQVTNVDAYNIGSLIRAAKYITKSWDKFRALREDPHRTLGFDDIPSRAAVGCATDGFDSPSILDTWDQTFELSFLPPSARRGIKEHSNTPGGSHVEELSKCYY